MAQLGSHSWVWTRCHKEAPAAVGMVLFTLNGAPKVSCFLLLAKSIF